MMPRLLIQRASNPELPRGGVPIDLALPPGLHAIVGSPAQGTTAISGLVGGIVRPRSGRVLVSGLEPYREPSLRARIGVMLPEPMLPQAETVEHLLRLCSATRGGDARSMLERLGLAALALRRLATLSADEARAIELVIALATPNPLVLALTEPFANTAGAHRDVVIEALVQAAAGGASVLAMTASVSDAAELGGQVHLFEAGRITRTLDALDVSELPGSEATLCVVTNEPRTLAAALSTHESVGSVTWDSTRGGSSVTVRGPDLDRLGLAIAQATQITGARVYSIQPVTPGLEEVRAAASGFALAAYHAAYRAGIARPAAAAPSPADPGRPSEASS